MEKQWRSSPQTPEEVAEWANWKGELPARNKPGERIAATCMCNLAIQEVNPALLGPVDNLPHMRSGEESFSYPCEIERWINSTAISRKALRERVKAHRVLYDYLRNQEWHINRLLEHCESDLGDCPLRTCRDKLTRRSSELAKLCPLVAQWYEYLSGVLETSPDEYPHSRWYV